MGIQDLILYEEEERSPLRELARVADDFARGNVLQEYRERKAEATLLRQQDDIACFEAFLREGQVDNTGMHNDLSLWTEISDGLVKAWMHWMLKRKGLSIGTVNIRLSTIRTYCRLSATAGHLPVEAYQRIKLIPLIGETEGHRIDAKREVTRVGNKKAEATRISPSHIALLRQRLRMLADTGDFFAASNLLLLNLLADHGLRCSEVSQTRVDRLRLDDGILRFYRQKRDDWLNIRLTAETLDAVQRYFSVYQPTAWLFPGAQEGRPLAQRTINWRVGQMGIMVNINHLSPHDLRHYFATFAQGDIGNIQQAGGWKNLTMLLKYRLENEIANEGVVMPGQIGWRDR